MTKLTPFNALALLGLLAGIPWREFARDDYMGFADAGDGARICDEVPLETSNRIAEILGLDSDGNPLLAVIGGDGLQIELHGVTGSGDMLACLIPLRVEKI